MGKEESEVKQPMTLTEIMTYTLRSLRTEPVKRVKDLNHVPRGMRNRVVQPRYVTHTYPIKGGVPLTVPMVDSVNSSWSPMLRALTKQP